jgi:hypothetical protein
MSKPIVTSKYFSCSSLPKTTPTVKKQQEQDEEPTLELSQHTDTNLNKQLSEWNVDTQEESSQKEEASEEPFLSTLSEKEIDLDAKDVEETENNLDWYTESKIKLDDDNELDQRNISKGEEEMMDQVENKEEECIDNQRPILDINQFNATKKPLHSINLNQFKAPIEATENKPDLTRFNAPTTESPKQKLEISQFKAPTGPVNLSQFKMPLDPRYKSRMPPKKPKARKQVPDFKYLQGNTLKSYAFTPPPQLTQ